MDRSAFLGKPWSLFALLLMFTAYPQKSTLGGEAARSADAAAWEDLRSRQIALSLRIAEAKGEGPSRAHFQSLLRHNKRKPFRNPLDDVALRNSRSR